MTPMTNLNKELNTNIAPCKEDKQHDWVKFEGYHPYYICNECKRWLVNVSKEKMKEIDNCNKHI